MGNQLVGIAPSAIFPVEHYLTDLTDLKFDVSLGSTRFLKVARAESQEGLIVVKLFAIPDPSFPLSFYKDRLEEIRATLSAAVNCLPFQKLVITDKAGVIMREYAKYSLYDRISTRPFLTNIEKRWITFQVLYALYQCHKVGVCHGDIKLENIMLTSWNWVLLVDFASFKPTFLPEDNPADYSYFFDTSRRRTCYIAPERFIKSMTTDSSTMFNENPCNSGDLKPVMDIFSAGCALLELWNEGQSPFDLSQLLAYKSGEYSPQKHLDRLEDVNLHTLITSMIHKDPSCRLTAETYLSHNRGHLFPEYFYTFLQSYMQIFSASPVLSPDEKIGRLKNDIGNIFKFLCSAEENETGERDKDNDGLVIIVSLVTSTIRGLHDCSSKLQSLEILYELALHANEETIMDRILPYIMFLIQDHNSRVKVAAINTITKCLAVVRHVPRSDANIFPEYVLPGLAPLAIDPSPCVRAAYARNIATLAETALRYLEHTQADYCERSQPKNGSTATSSSRLNYDLELQTLHEMVQQTVSTLLTNSPTLVKQTLMDSGITKLCVFFGKQKSNDILLSHIITFLNDNDKELRGTFFECIVGVAAFLGSHCSHILTPLLLQGLNDTCEFVTMKAIHAMASLTELGLITKPQLRELISECAILLVHPNLWIRHAVVALICSASIWLSPLDVQCKIVPVVSPYMKYPLIQIEKPELLLESLIDPIKRTVYDSVVQFDNLEGLLKVLDHNMKSRISISAGERSFRVDPVEIPPAIRKLLSRLEANAMSPTVEEYLLKMAALLLKINKHHLLAEKEREREKLTKQDGVIEIETRLVHVRCHSYNLEEARAKNEFESKSEISRRQSESTNSGGPPSRATTSRPSSPAPEVTRFANELGPNMSLHERSYIQYRTAKCSKELRTLIARQQDHFMEAHRSKEWEEQTACKPQLPPPGWHLGGTLVAHLHEHRGPVTRLAPIPETPYFASGSMDGTVRLWDCSKIEGRNIANRSVSSHRLATGNGVIALAVCENGQSIAAASQDGCINVLRVDTMSKHISHRFAPLHTRQLNADDDGLAVDMQYMDRQNVLVYATLYGSLVGWDLRAPGCAWRLENGTKHGVITTFCIDAHQSLLTLGTNSGAHIAWDLRFQLPIANIPHPTGARIRKIVHHPIEPSWILSTFQGNNEISMWNVETAQREKVLWASSNPPLSKISSNNNSVLAMLTGCIDRSGFLLAAGTDQRLRFWDLDDPTKSYMAIPAPNDTITACHVTYERRLIDGMCVFLEQIDERHASGAGTKDEVPRAGPEPPPAGHRDSITDIALCKTSQCFLLTASRDGVIKVWK